jgi:bifunctional DNase/RNase
VRLSLLSPQRVVVLKQTDVDRYLAIWVGPYEAESITVALQEVEVARPLTHDLLKNLFTVFNGKVLRAEIVAMKEDTFYGNIVAEVGGKILDIDSRPSDAIALALRAHVPILVSKDVMDTCGITPERDIQAERPTAQPDKILPMSAPLAGGDADLDVFEDFLKKLKDEPVDGAKPKDMPGDDSKPKDVPGDQEKPKNKPGPKKKPPK